MSLSNESDNAMSLSCEKVASVYVYGNILKAPSHEREEDECFILAFDYSDVHYKITAYGIVSCEDDIPTVGVFVPQSEGFTPTKRYIDCLSVITASAFLHDRQQSIVTIIVTIPGNDEKKSLTFSALYDPILANGKLEKIMQKIHRVLYVEKKIQKESAGTLTNIKFPYKSMREGQELFIRKAYSTIKRRSRLFVEAPTGIGKTISALYAAVRAMGDGCCDKIFYLTAKGSTANEAFKACENLFSVGARLRCIQLAAKMRICPLSNSYDGECEPGKCPLMRGYQARSEEAIYELLFTRYGYSSDIICETAKRYNICPYELSLDLSEMCGVVICDYNYVFDPKVRIKRYFDDNAEKKDYAFLIDEAHNLVIRAKEMYSQSLCMSDIVAFYAELSEACSSEGGEIIFGKIKNELNDFAKRLKKISSLCRDSIVKDANGVKRGFYISSTPINGLLSAVTDFKDKLSKFCDDIKDSVVHDTANRFLKELYSFASCMSGESEGMRYYIEIEDSEIIFKCMCVDPSAHLRERFAFSSAAVLFSATFSPQEYYTETLSPDKRPTFLTLASPFDKANCFCAVYTGVSTRFEKRDSGRSEKRILSLIASVISGKKGNYILYFPSYSYMRAIYSAFSQKYPKIRTIVQTQDMTYSKRRDFMEFFENDTSVLRVGFCVLGGSFSEGIDLPGDRLIGTVIFGVGLPGISNEQNIIKEYYDFKDDGKDGYDFAYTYPGFNNVLQAAGRVIRSENDHGVIIFADERYAEEKYKRMMPERFKGLNSYADLEELREDLCDFWRNS